MTLVHILAISLIEFSFVILPEKECGLTFHILNYDVGDAIAQIREGKAGHM